MLKSFIKRYERLWPVLFFVLGFGYDIWSLGDIDSYLSIAKQGAYLVLIGVLLGLEASHIAGKFTPRGKLAKIWKFHEEAIHFFYGTLLSEYTLFFFKSASLWSSFLFIVLLGGLVLFNEFKRIGGQSGIAVRAGLFGLCLVTYFVYLVPLVLGYVGVVPFLLAIAVSALVTLVLRSGLSWQLAGATEFLNRQVFYPVFGVLTAFVILYFTHLIPPIPLSIGYLGVFHEVKKESGHYLLSYDPRGHRFWQNGEAEFLARPGDRPHAFVRVLSPSRFSDQVQVRWLYKDPRAGWLKADAIPIQIAGGRKEGFRGFTFKSNFQPGDWQVRVETTDGREMGRLYFVVREDPTSEPRELASEAQ